MTKTSSKVKNKYAASAYDRITFIVKKGEKQILTDAANRQGKSLSRFVLDCINESAGGLLTVLDDNSKQQKSE